VVTVDVVIYGLLSPQEKGPETLEALHQQYPRLPIILLSENDEPIRTDGAGEVPARATVRKVVKPKEIVQIVDRLFPDPHEG
jgi:DNA-binding NarL/FixJ family response regulator